MRLEMLLRTGRAAVAVRPSVPPTVSSTLLLRHKERERRYMSAPSAPLFAAAAAGGTAGPTQSSSSPFLDDESCDLAHNRLAKSEQQEQAEPELKHDRIANNVQKLRRQRSRQRVPAVDIAQSSRLSSFSLLNFISKRLMKSPPAVAVPPWTVIKPAAAAAVAATTTTTTPTASPTAKTTQKKSGLADSSEAFPCSEPRPSLLTRWVRFLLVPKPISPSSSSSPSHVLFGSPQTSTSAGSTIFAPALSSIGTNRHHHHHHHFHRRNKAQRPLHFNRDGGGNYSPYSSATSQTRNQISVRYTEFDRDGNMSTTAGDFLRTELCARHKLQPRDLRKLDPSFTQQLPSILVRPTTVLVNLYYVKAIVKHDSLVLLDSFDDVEDEDRAFFLMYLKERLQATRQQGIVMESLPYEFRALEAILEYVCNILREEHDEIRPRIEFLLRNMEDNVSKDQLKEVLVLTKELARLVSRGKEIHDTISDLLSNDDDLAGMYLSDKAEGKLHTIDDHEEVELLLESYLQRTDETTAGLMELTQALRATEDFHQALLDYKRNAFLMLEINIAVATLAATWGSMLAGIFGMNVPNPFEDSIWSFPVISTAVFMINVIVFVFLTRVIVRYYSLPIPSKASSSSNVVAANRNSRRP